MIGIDLGPRAIKVLELEKAGDEFRVTKAGIAYLESNSSSPEALIEKQQTALAALKQALQIKDKSQVVLSLPSNAIFVRYLEILKSEKKKDDAFVRFEAKQQIPLPLEEVAWDYFFLKAKAGSAKQAVLMAIKNDLLEEGKRVIAAANLKIRCINLGLVNLLNIGFLNICFKRNETGILVDIGSDATGMIVSRRGELWLRSLSFGSQRITREIAESLGLNQKEAEAVERQSREDLEREDPSRAATVRDVIINQLMSLGDEMERSLEFYKTEQQRREPEGTAQSHPPRLILSGGIAAMPGIEEFFQNRLNMPSGLLQIDRRIKVSDALLKRIAVVGEGESTFDARTFPLYFGVAAGAAIAQSDRAEFKINFLRQQMATSGKAKTGKLFGGLSVLFLGLAGAAFLFFLLMTARINQGRGQAMDEILNRFEQFREPVIQIEKAQKELKDQAEVLIHFAAKRYLWLGIMNDLTGIVPLNIWIEEWSSHAALEPGQDDLLELKGYMISYDEFNEFISGIKQLPFVKNVTPEAIESGEGQFRFSLKIVVQPELPKEA